MKPKENNNNKLVSIPEKSLLSLVALQLKDRVLFPEKLKDARDYINKMKESSK